jgi:hypothetical protein
VSIGLHRALTLPVTLPLQELPRSAGGKLKLVVADPAPQPIAAATRRAGP